MKKIITITLNPAFDLHYELESFKAERENYVESVLCDAGGKGINISRALTFSGIGNTAYVILGRENSVQFETSMQKDGINYIPLYTDGRIRENITIHPKGAKETRISLDNFSINSELLRLLYTKLEGELGENTLVALSGRLPRGIEKCEVVDFLKNIVSGGVKLAVDSNSLTPEDLISISPWFIKPNEQEIAAFLGREIKETTDAAAASRKLVLAGVAREVMISLGALGSAWSDGDRCAIVSVPKIESPVSTVGAGDSTVAGYLASVAKGEPYENALRLACSFGTAACLTSGTRPPRTADIEKIFKDTFIKNV